MLICRDWQKFIGVDRHEPLALSLHGGEIDAHGPLAKQVSSVRATLTLVRELGGGAAATISRVIKWGKLMIWSCLIVELAKKDFGASILWDYTPGIPAPVIAEEPLVVDAALEFLGLQEDKEGWVCKIPKEIRHKGIDPYLGTEPSEVICLTLYLHHTAEAVLLFHAHAVKAHTSPRFAPSPLHSRRRHFAPPCAPRLYRRAPRCRCCAPPPPPLCSPAATVATSSCSTLHAPPSPYRSPPHAPPSRYAPPAPPLLPHCAPHRVPRPSRCAPTALYTARPALAVRSHCTPHCAPHCTLRRRRFALHRAPCPSRRAPTALNTSRPALAVVALHTTRCRRRDTPPHYAFPAP
ncbi:hypothetical protein C8R44DRAFT_877750 [Mycena epipterygia]|nr:hypothetical protein C8R44DRAFT_877750 [Mycena epipterygia]